MCQHPSLPIIEENKSFAEEKRGGLMDAQRFDTWTRRLRSRRTALTGLAGGVATMVHLAIVADADAKSCPAGKKRCRGRCIAKRIPCCPPKKKRCGKRCIPKRTPCCKPSHKPCGNRCILKNQCCTHADCGIGRLCVSNRCVVGQGTCPTGADNCATTDELTCSQDPIISCYCLQSTAGQTRCGGEPLGTCGGCLEDADCARDHPHVPGAFCMQTGPMCGCPNSTFCIAPCAG
jgi:hypothetical protein